MNVCKVKADNRNKTLEQKMSLKIKKVKKGKSWYNAIRT